MNLKILIPLIILFVLLASTAIYFGFFNNKAKVIEEGKTTVIKSPFGEFNPTEPQMTLPLKDIPLGVIKIKISRDQGFQPNKFNVKAGEAVSLALTSIDGTHTLYFENEILKKVKIDVGAGETRGISFVAPQQKGEYKFYCDIPGHRQNGEEGAMIVK